LQKSTSGAGSTPSGMGLAPTPHAREGNLPARFCLVQRGFCLVQRGEEAPWPARVTSPATVTPRGPWESRGMHAAANPRLRTAAMPCGRVGNPVMRGPGDARATAPVNLGAAEGAIVDGRRSGAASSAAFDEAAGEPGLPARRRSLQSLLTKGPWQRRRVGRGASEATSRARFAAENAATGRHRAEELSIGAPPGPRGVLFDASVRGLGSGRTPGRSRG